jgi:hypothetical protein
MLIPPPDLQCGGNLTWVDGHPGETIQGTIWVYNAGGGRLQWEITDWPSWGVWDFGSYFPGRPSGGTWFVFFNLTAPVQEHETFTGQMTAVNKEKGIDYGIINASLSTHATSGYNVAEHIIGFIRNLHVEENMTSFSLLIGVGIRIIEYDDGGLTAIVVPYLFRQIQWSNDVLFDGILRPHFIKGIVRYRVD